MAVLKMSTTERPVSAEDAAIGRAVHELLWERGIPQQRVYDALRISRSSLGKKMRGEVRWSAKDVIDVARIIGVPPGDLLPVDTQEYLAASLAPVSPIMPVRYSTYRPSWPMGADRHTGGNGGGDHHGQDQGHD